MTPEITDKHTWYEVYGPDGTEWIPSDLIGELKDNSVFAFLYGSHDIPPELADYTRNTKFYEISEVKGYGARLSASGYMDCTDWTVHSSVADAKEYLVETYDS
jgi:hypothetical protein